MAIDPSGSSTTGNVDLNSLLQSALAGGSMSNIFGGDASGVVMGLLLGRLGLFGNNIDGNRNEPLATESQVNSIQANNNAMLLLKDIQDTGQDIVATINSTSQTGLIQQLQNQIANLQGQADIKAAIATAAGTVVNEVHEGTQQVGNQLDSITTAMLAGWIGRAHV